MPNWKKIVTSGSNAAFNSLIVSSTITGSISGSLTGSLFGTASFLSGSTTVGNNLVTLPNPNAVTYLRVNADNTVTPRTPSQVLTDLGVASTILLFRDFNTYTVTNVVTDTITWSGSIPANTLQTNDFVEFNSIINTNSRNVDYKLFINTNNNLTNATQIAYFTNGGGTGNTGFQRYLYVTSSGINGFFKISPGSSISSPTPFQISSATASLVPINTTVTQYLLLSIAMNPGTAASASSVQSVIATITR